ncbi:hypothetical protein [Frigoribacterium salinisoli]
MTTGSRDDHDHPSTDPAEGRPTGRRPLGLWVVITLLTAEFLLVVGVSAFLLIELLTVRPDSYPSAVALLVLSLVAAAWLGAVVLGALRGRAWIRGAAVTWQVLQIAVGVGSLRGQFAEPAIGWALVVPAVLVVGLLLTPRVVAATAARDDPRA